MSIKKILIIEDEEKILDMIKKYLEQEMFKVYTAENGDKGMELWKSETPDLIILDLMLPEINGLDLCREIRGSSTVPIIMLTAKSQETDKIIGLEVGADDYITKPFSLAELTARIRANLRRNEYSKNKEKEEIIIKGDLYVNLSNVEVKVKEIPVTLTPTEFKILALLIQNPGRVYSRLQLLDAALGEVYSGYERSIDTHVSNLRHKIESDAANPGYIKTVYGIGYKFDS